MQNATESALPAPAVSAYSSHRRGKPAASAVHRVLIGAAFILSGLFIGVPMLVIFTYAFREGMGVYFSQITQPATLHAIWLTVLTAIVVVPINMVFGICAAWLVTRYRFPGRQLLMSLIEIPFSVSPIVAGVTYLFLYGSQGLLGPLLESYDIKIMFTVPAIFLVSLFVTSPFVARELIPLMQTQGSEDEEAAITLGATGLQTFRYVTLPNIKWALLYGAVLCNARVMGEFGAVSVVSGAIRGQTNTLPLQIELLFNDYNVTGAFAASSTLALIAIVTLVLKYALERKQRAG
ncbi:sulfate ABC transporter permease subunit CysW [Phyllobacterium sp. SYP-B3895]|uniref:sulfate ABC transporter permease subunit CysW n=1 Tax=Phyllobacterium sp. SYP-B3895 TaxID=2663240 RepID=UPI0012998DA1|nr:sulfate ABC transporter permease subunit CysW [Phyllobacterium sp. SYP-B3895]MRG56953.1 sulfate ABC transporter permease subunit CysW [Phyllobacterium sp. SYP-B3895]